MEDALRESEERYRMLSELTSDFTLKIAVGENSSVLMDTVSPNFIQVMGQVVASLTRMPARRSKEQKVIEVLEEHQGRIQAMAAVHELLYESESLSNIDLCRYIEKLCGQLKQLHRGRGDMQFKVGGHNILIDIAQAEPCALAMNELISNSVKHAFPQGRSGKIEITARCVNGEIEILISDDGQGMPNGTDPKAAKTMGHMLVFGLIEKQLKGTWSVSTDHSGTRHTIRFEKEKKSGKSIHL